MTIEIEQEPKYTLTLTAKEVHDIGEVIALWDSTIEGSRHRKTYEQGIRRIESLRTKVASDEAKAEHERLTQSEPQATCSKCGKDLWLGQDGYWRSRVGSSGGPLTCRRWSPHNPAPRSKETA